MAGLHNLRTRVVIRRTTDMKELNLKSFDEQSPPRIANENETTYPVSKESGAEGESPEVLRRLEELGYIDAGLDI